MPARVKEAMRALELISDTFLPVNEIAQAAAPEIMRQGREFRDQYAAEMRRRWEIARMYLDRAGHCRYVSPEGGCYVTVGLQQDEEATAEAILWSTRSLVHPGHFYEIDPHHLVISYALEAELLHLRFPQILREIGRQGTVAESQ